MRHSRPSVVATFLALAIAACADDAEPCVEVDCVPTVSVGLSLREPGDYVVSLTLTLQGDATPCTLTLPTPDVETLDPNQDCAFRGVSVLGQLPNEPLLVGHPGAVRSIAVRITRSGVLVADESFSPQYVDPPPNSPACPAKCREAAHVVHAR